MRILKGDEVSNLLRNLTSKDASTLLDSLSSGLASYTLDKRVNDGDKSIRQPLRTVIQTKNQVLVLVMPVSNASTTSVKVISVPHKGDLAGATTIYNATGKLLAVLNAAEITAFRTALATMTILTRWNPSSEQQIVVFGAGKQAEWHVRLALLLVPKISKVTVINRGKDRLERFQQQVLADLQKSSKAHFNAVAQEGNDDYEAQKSEELGNADIICCCTPSVEPLFTAKDLPRGRTRFLSLIGSYKPNMQEVDGETIRLGGKIWVDSKEACMEEAGELISAGLSVNDLIEVGELFAGEREAESAWKTDSELTIFKCVGMGLMDLVISTSLLTMAEKLNIGTVMDGF